MTLETILSQTADIWFDGNFTSFLKTPVGNFLWRDRERGGDNKIVPCPGSLNDSFLSPEPCGTHLVEAWCKDAIYDGTTSWGEADVVLWIEGGQIQNILSKNPNQTIHVYDLDKDVKSTNDKEKLFHSLISYYPCSLMPNGNTHS